MCSVSLEWALQGYPFRRYTLCADALEHFKVTFDYHVGEQEKAHLVEQEEAKYHGKSKTRNAR